MSSKFKTCDGEIVGLVKHVEFLNSEPDRIFILPVEVAGYSHGLAEGLVKLGKNVTFVEIVEARFKNASSVALSYEFLPIHRNSASAVGYLRWLAARSSLAWKISKTADLVITQFAMGLLPLNLDLILYKIKRVKVASLAGFGSEARPVQMNHPHTNHKKGLGGRTTLAFRSLWQRMRILFLYKFTDFFFTSPQTSHFVPGQFFNFLDLGHPLSDDTVLLATRLFETKTSDPAVGGPFRISHVPSTALIKGTESIRSIMTKIEEEFPEVAYSELSNVSHEELLTHVSKQDLIIDQLYSDYPFPVTSAEAYLLGVPSIVGGYFLDWPGQFYQNFAPPSVQILPELLFQALHDILTENRSSLRSKARIGHQKVLTRFGSRQVASRFLGAITGQHDSGVALLTRPTVPYLGGLGAEREVIKQFTDGMLARVFLPELNQGNQQN